MRRKRGFTVLELMITCGLFTILTTVLVVTLLQVTSIWRRTSSHDDGVAQVLKAKSALVRDLTNASGQPGQFAVTSVSPSLSGSGSDGAALTFLSSDAGTTSSNWSDSSVSGVATMQSEITYSLYIPADSVTNPYGIVPSGGNNPDGSGFEQQCAFKWLMRRVDTPATPPTEVLAWDNLIPGPRPSLPSVSSANSQTQLVADRFFQFKVLSTAPVWTLSVSAVAIADASRKLSLGSVALGGSSYVVTQQFAVPAHN